MRELINDEEDDEINFKRKSKAFVVIVQWNENSIFLLPPYNNEKPYDHQIFYLKKLSGKAMNVLAYKKILK